MLELFFVLKFWNCSPTKVADDVRAGETCETLFKFNDPQAMVEGNCVKTSLGSWCDFLKTDCCRSLFCEEDKAEGMINDGFGKLIGALFVIEACKVLF